MSQRFTSRGGGRKKEKYVPMKDRPQSNTVPLCDQPEAQPYLLTIETMLEKSTATLQDSIWARPRPNATTPARPPQRQPTHTVQKMSPVIKIEASSPVAWNTEASKPPGVGLVGSRWAVQAPQTANPKPEGMTFMNILETQRTFVPHHPRGNPPSSYIPPHLRGIDPAKADEAPQPVVQTIVEDPAVPNTYPAPASPVANNHNAEGEEWARKMGLFPKSAPAKKVPGTKNSSGNQGPRQNSPMNNIQTKTSALTQNSCGGHPSQQNSMNSVQAKTSALSQNAPGMTNAFDNKRFHLKQDNTEQFQQFVQNSATTNGKKYTFNGPTPTPTAQQQRHAPATNSKHPSLNRPAVASQQQPVISHKPTAQFSGQNGMKSNGMKTENRPPFSKPDSHAMFSPNQIATSSANAKTVIVRENVAVSTPIHNGRWPSLYVTEAKSVNEKIIHDLKATEHVPTIGCPLTQDALVMTTGAMPRDHSLNFEDQISDDGVVEQTKEGIRASQGVDAATQLLDWDRKRWAPPPCDWENDRAGFDDSFIPDYIKEWREDLPCGPSIQVNPACDDFRLGKCPVDNDVLIDAVEQPESTPDIANSCDEMKRLHQTAIIDANNYLARMEKKQRNAVKNKEYSQARHLQIATAVDEPNPFSPKIDMYVRPVQEKDADAITKIYNHYVATSIIPEDQEPISIEDSFYLVQNSKKEKLPFVVAVKGRLPSNLDAQGRPRSAKTVQPQVESVIGFAFAERFNYAFSGKVNGRSRGTVSLQLYVHPEHTRKGVGRNTFDQLLHCMATAYTFKNGCPWINPERDPVHEPNGCGLIHQMIMQVPVLKRNDPTFPWLSKFLYNKFWFKEENRMKSVARTSINQGAAYFVDMVILQCELLHEAEFEAFN